MGKGAILGGKYSMNRLLLIAAGIVLPFLNIAQVSSTCNVPALLYDNYEMDIKQMAIARMHQVAPNDLVHVRIPQNHIDTVSGRLAAVFNTIDTLMESDTVFNVYCVHDVNDMYQLTKRIMLEVDTNVAWTQAWRNLNTATGNPFIDDLMTRYDLILEDYFEWSFGHYALLSTDSLWNEYALIDSLSVDSGILGGAVDNLIGGAGSIEFNESGGTWLFDFYFEFNDCFDGCDNYRKWSFRVNTDCSVDYLGYTDWGVFGTSALPPPIHCNLTTELPNIPKGIYVKAFPNPVRDQLTFQWDNPQNGIFIEIVDLSGKVLVKTESIAAETITVDLKHLTSGIYLYRTTCGSEMHTGKFLKY